VPTQSEHVQSARRRNLTRLLSPRHIVFLGGERTAWAIRTCRTAGYAGQMLAVHPRKPDIEGVPCVPRVADLPVAPDAAFLGIPADATLEVVGELAQKGAGGAVCYASGFAEMGETGRRRNEALLEAAGDLAIVGPNCFGIINYVNHGSLWSVPYPTTSVTRGAAVVGQSGNLCINLSMNQREVPFSYIISAGNQAVLGFEDYVDVLVDDPNVTAIGLFLEGIRDIPAFSAACRKALSKRLPIVALRIGVSELGAKVAASHTNSLAGQNELYDALFERLGILTTATVPQFLELLKALSVGRLPRGRRLTVFSSSGGDNGMATDFASAAGFALPAPTPAQTAAVQALLPDYGVVSNPLDFTAGYWGQEDRLTPMFKHMLSDARYDQAVLVIDHPRGRLLDDVDPALAAMVRALAAATAECDVPGAVVCVNPESMPEQMRRQVLDAGLVPLQGLHDAFEVLGRMVDYATFQKRIAERGLPALPLRAPSPHPELRVVEEAESKRRLAACGVPIPDGRVVGFAELREAAEACAGPLALKAVSSDLPHKTEAGGVALALSGADAVVAAAEEMRRRIASRQPGLTIDRFLLEPMVENAVAEMLVGIKIDPHFGPVLVIGAGGVLVELLRDVRQLLLPADRSEIESAIRSLKSFPLLDGYRGRPKADLRALIAAIEAIAEYATARLTTVAEIDVNPIMVLPAGQGVVAVDALILERA
jgi:acetate---CoA ligase (ADP-forming)